MQLPGEGLARAGARAIMRTDRGAKLALERRDGCDDLVPALPELLSVSSLADGELGFVDEAQREKAMARWKEWHAAHP